MISSLGHKFHIPVLGVGFSVDSAVRVSKYGISSVLSLVDDVLLEKLREKYSRQHGLSFEPIDEQEEDARARRVTAYLNMVNIMVKDQFDALRNSTFEAGSELCCYFEMLPDYSQLKKKYLAMRSESNPGVVEQMRQWLFDHMKPGSIDVNIMTKVDKVNYTKRGEALPYEYNDAHSALRGFAMSDLESSLILSAGMNPRLYGYMANFDDFYPREDGSLRKKIVIKVSDYRSALIQGKFLAKKGLWVSEYRIESGLNCGGHAFATDGYLLGPILEEFKQNKDELCETVGEMLVKGLERKNKTLDRSRIKFKVTVQGGVGKSSEQDFLIRRYGVSSVGWGSPFLLVPEVTNVDEYTLEKLSKAREEDFYLSEVSPLGVPFNNLRDNAKDLEKMDRVKAGKPGSACLKQYLRLNTEMSKRPICTASITYINRKVKELKVELGEDGAAYKEAYNKVVLKACLCEGLVAPAVTANSLDFPKISSASSVCPGPNLAYFSKIVTLREMVDHIYGRINLLTDPHRPNMFIKELNLYIEYFRKKVEDSMPAISEKTAKYLDDFQQNLMDGIAYYKQMIPDISEETAEIRQRIMCDLEALEARLERFSIPVMQEC